MTEYHWVPEYRDEEPVLPFKFTGNILLVTEREGYPPHEQVVIRHISDEESAQEICDRLNSRQKVAA